MLLQGDPSGLEIDQGGQYKCQKLSEQSPNAVQRTNIVQTEYKCCDNMHGGALSFLFFSLCLLLTLVLRPSEIEPRAFCFWSPLYFCYFSLFGLIIVPFMYDPLFSSYCPSHMIVIWPITVNVYKATPGASGPWFWPGAYPVVLLIYIFQSNLSPAYGWAITVCCTSIEATPLLGP